TRIYDPSEVSELTRLRVEPPGVAAGERVGDPALAGWRYGADWVEQQGPAASSFLVAPVREGAARAWLGPVAPARAAAILGEGSGRPLDVLAALRDARPLDLRRPDPEHRELRFDAEGPSLVVISELADPEWQAVWSGPGGARPAEVRRAFGVKGRGAWRALGRGGSGRPTGGATCGPAWPSRPSAWRPGPSRFSGSGAVERV